MLYILLELPTALDASQQAEHNADIEEKATVAVFPGFPFSRLPLFGTTDIRNYINTLLSEYSAPSVLSRARPDIYSGR